MGLPLADPVLGLLLLLPGGHHGALELWGTRGGDAAAIRVTPRVGTPFGDQTVVFRPKIPTQGVPEGDGGTTVAPRWPRSALGATRDQGGSSGARQTLICPPKNLLGAPGQQDGAEPGSPPYRKRWLSPALKQTQSISACSGWATSHHLLGILLREGETSSPSPLELTQGPASPLMVSASASLMKSWYKAM